MKPHLHANASAGLYGGKPEDYQAIHDFIDSSKAHLADVRHRAINDGEICVFSVYEPRYRFSPETEADDDDDKFFYPWEKEIAREIQGRKEFYQALSLLEDVLMLICEDGEITYTRGADDLVIGECSHD